MAKKTKDENTCKIKTTLSPWRKDFWSIESNLNTQFNKGCERWRAKKLISRKLVKKKKVIVYFQRFSFFFFFCSLQNAEGFLTYLDTSIGKKIVSLRTLQGSLNVMCQNPSNAIIHLGHHNGKSLIYYYFYRTTLYFWICWKPRQWFAS